MQQSHTGTDKIIAYVAADAAVGEIDGFILDPDDKFGIDIDRTEIIYKNRGPQAMVLTQDVVQ